MGLAFTYISKNGIATEKAYPYMGYDETCHYDGKGEKPFIDWCAVKPYSSEALRSAIS